MIYGLVVRSPQAIPAPAISAPRVDVEIIESHQPLTHDHLQSPDSPFAYQRFPDGSALVIWMDAIQFAISMDGSRVRFFAPEPSRRDLVFDYLIAQVLSVALVQRGVESLHATAVEVAGKAIAFLGDSGFGKSTLAAACICAGARMLTDDLLVLADESSGYHVLPGAQRIKLTPETAAATIGVRDGVAMDDERGKFVYPLSDAEYCAQPVLLERMMVLRPESLARDVSVLPQTLAFRELLAATFNPLDQTSDRLQRHMKFVASVGSAVPVETLHVPWDLEDMEETVRLVTAH